MRRILLALFLLTLLPLLARAAPDAALQAPGEELRVEIVERGIYETAPGRIRRLPNGLGENIVEAVDLVRSTTAIPARPGISFGFEFRVTGGQPGGEAELTTTVIFPPPGLIPPETGVAVPASALGMRVPTGGDFVLYRGYTFDHEWEVAPGPWRFELRAGDRLLAAQSFIVTQESGFGR